VKVSILIPSVNRPERLRECLQAILATTKGIDAEVICSLSLTDAKSHAVALEANAQVTDNHIGLTGGTIAWNEASEVCRGDVLSMIGDDSIVKGDWLKIALRELGHSGVVGLNDLSRTDGERFSTHPVVTRDYLIQHNGGVLCVPHYVHYFVDVELCEHAQALGKYHFAKEAIIDHQWKGNKSDKDNVYSWAQRYFDADAQCYKQRKQRGFPVDFVGFLQ
jgi:glycosyltransferase involved in cell wall biosynthesis